MTNDDGEAQGGRNLSDILIEEPVCEIDKAWTVMLKPLGIETAA